MTRDGCDLVLQTTKLMPKRSILISHWHGDDNNSRLAFSMSEWLIWDSPEGPPPGGVDRLNGVNFGELPGDLS
jgi:hypothetical protein